METADSVIGGLFILLIVLAIYFAPIIVAYDRKIKNKGTLVVVNVFLGWTLIGWVVALAMALSDKVDDLSGNEPQRHAPDAPNRSNVELYDQFGNQTETRNRSEGRGIGEREARKRYGISD